MKLLLALLAYGVIVSPAHAQALVGPPTLGPPPVEAPGRYRQEELRDQEAYLTQEIVRGDMHLAAVAASMPASTPPHEATSVTLRNQAAARAERIKTASATKLRPLAAAECKAYYRLTGSSGTPVNALCADIASKSVELQRYYALQYNYFIQLTLTEGPTAAAVVTQQCLKNAASEKGKADTGGLLTCLSLFRNTKIVKLAAGDGTPQEYVDVFKKANAPPVFTAPASSDDKETRAKVRSLVIHTCVAEATSYVQAICSAIAFHELFAKDPYGDNGELAKQLGTVVQVYQATQIPTEFVKHITEDVYRSVGVPAPIVRIISDPTVVVTQPPGKTIQDIHDALPCVRSFVNNYKC